MKFFYALALAGLSAAAPASASVVLGDYNVYASNNAYISGGSYGNIASGSFTNANGSGGGNFSSQTSSSAALTQVAQALSANYAGLNATGTISSGQWTPGDITLTGSSTGTNVFYIDGNVWSQLYALTLTGVGDGAIINVSGNNFSNSVNLNLQGFDANKVLFNFYEADKLNFGGMNFNGSILAPEALVTIMGGSVKGSVISNAFHSEGANVGGASYLGFANKPAGPVPEPATWAMMLIGFGAIGFLMRRGRSHRADTMPATETAH